MIEDLPNATVIDLSGATFVDSYGMVVVACAALAATERAERLEVRGPSNLNAARYLARMELPEFLAQQCGVEDHGLPNVQHWELEAATLCELRRFESGTLVGDLEEILLIRLDGVAGDVVAEIVGALYEISDNLSFHAQTDSGIVAAQVYDRGSPQARVDLAIGDVGIGIARSLEGGDHDPSTDLEAITLALTEFVSGTGDPTRGLGLPSVVENVRSVGGTTTIRTGRGIRVLHPRAEATDRVGARIPGTVVSVSIPCGKADDDSGE
jgi:hypothetical protein